MGRKSWLKSVKNVFKSSPSAKDSDKRMEWPSPEVAEEEEMPETVSVEHFPADTSVDGEADEEERKCIAAAAVRPAGCGRLSREEKAAVIVQSYYRGYLARRARRALRGLVRLQALVRGHAVRKQAQMTMRCMQSLMRVQARVRARRLNLIHNHAYEHLPCSRRKRLYAMDDPYCIKEEEIDEDDDDDYDNGGTYHVGGSKSPYFKGGQSTVMRSQRRDDNVVDQEKALAYAFSCQDGPQWGWNWLEHWMATKHQSPSHHHGTTLPENSHTTVPNMLDTMSEKTVEIDTNLTKFSRHRFARHEEGEEEEEEERSIRMQQAIPSYMAVTQSAKAKARTDVKVDGQRRMQSGMRHSGHSPDSSCGGDGRTPPFIGRMGKKEHGRV